jgi:hypothetical protein
MHSNRSCDGRRVIAGRAGIIGVGGRSSSGTMIFEGSALTTSHPRPDTDDGGEGSSSEGKKLWGGVGGTESKPEYVDDGEREGVCRAGNRRAGGGADAVRCLLTHGEP